LCKIQEDAPHKSHDNYRGGEGERLGPPSWARDNFVHSTSADFHLELAFYFSIEKRVLKVSSLQDTNKAIVRKFNKEFIEGGNFSVYDELVSSTFVDHSGHDAVPNPRAAYFFITQVFRPAFPDVKVIIHDQFAEGDTVVTRKSYQGTHKGPFLGMPGTGKAINLAVIDIIKLRDGKYVEHWGSADMFGLMQQLKPQ
jgi:predicted ester cyclase